MYKLRQYFLVVAYVCVLYSIHIDTSEFESDSSPRVGSINLFNGRVNPSQAES